MASPYRLSFQGTGQDRVDFGSALNAYSTMTINAWFKPTTPSATNKVILSNGGGINNGFEIRQSSSPGKIELVVGNVDSISGYQGILQAQSPVGYWKLDELSGTTAADSSGNNHPGTYTGVTLNQSGPIPSSNQAVSFPGPTSYVTVLDNSSIDITNTGLSISLWVYPTSNTNYQGMVAKGNGTGGGYPYLFALNSGTLNPSLYMTGINGTWANSMTTPLTLNAWNHVTVTYDGVSSLKYYLNGSPAGSYTVGAGPILNTNRPLEIGTMIDNGYPFHGKLDEVAIFNRELTSTDVSSIYNSSLVCVTNRAITSSNWNHLSAVFDSATKIAKLYVNTTLECSTRFPTDISSAATNLTMGARADGSNAWTGEISDWNVYQSTSVTPIQDMYTKTVGKYYSFPQISSSGLALYVDAMRANGVTFPGVGCGLTSWLDLSSNSFLGNFVNFSICNSTQGWLGSGPADPYRLDFVGTTAPANYVRYAHNAALNATTGITIFSIVKVGSNNSGYRGLIGKGTGTPNYGYLLTLPPGDNKMSLYLHNDVGTSPNATWANISSTTIPTGVWSMIAATWDSSDQKLNYYLNGKLDGFYTTPANTSIGTNAQPLNIGNILDVTASYPFDGSVAMLALYQRALSLSEIQAICLSYQSFITGLVCQ
jgi:hypothetical protein